MAEKTVNSREIGRVGNRMLLTGTFEAGQDDYVKLLSSSSRIVSCMIQNKDEAYTAHAVINSNNGTEGSLNGALYVDSENASVDTWYYEATFV